MQDAWFMPCLFRKLNKIAKMIPAFKFNIYIAQYIFTISFGWEKAKSAVEFYKNNRSKHFPINDLHLGWQDFQKVSSKYEKHCCTTLPVPSS